MNKKALVIWIGPALILLAILLLFANQIESLIPPGLRPTAVTLGGNPLLSLAIPGLAICLLISFILSVLVLHAPEGDDDEDIIAQNRHLWIAFALACIVIVLAAFNNYLLLQSRVAVLRADLTLFVRTITDAPQLMPLQVSRLLGQSSEQNGTRALDALIDDGLNQTSRIGKYLETTSNLTNTTALDAPMLALNHDASEAMLSAQRAGILAHDLLAQQPVRGTAGATYGPLATTTAQVVTLTEQISVTSAALIGSVRRTGARDTFALRQQNGVLAAQLDWAQALVRSIISIVPALQIIAIAPFFLVTAIEAILVFFPWLLLIMFILRKREYQVRAKAQVLIDLCLADAFLKRTPSVKNARQAGAPPGPKSCDVTSEARKELEAAIRLQAFRDGEYAVSLVVLTLIIATFWHFLIYPQEELGFAQWMSDGLGIRAFTDYLAVNITPLTAGFAGAYFFITQLLLRRYLAADLNPKVYVSAIVRMVVVFILSLILSLIGSANLLGWTWNGAVLVAFAAGIIPTAGVRWIMGAMNAIVKAVTFPGVLDANPLTDLEGLSAWDEARLQEENVQNVQNFATASLIDLFIHTNYSPKQVVDWMDQALLYIHTHDQWDQALRLAGVRTATNLLDCLCTDGAAGRCSNKPCSRDATKLAAAIKDAIAQAKAADAAATSRLPNEIPADTLMMIAQTIDGGPNIMKIENFWCTQIRLDEMIPPAADRMGNAPVPATPLPVGPPLPPVNP